MTITANGKREAGLQEANGHLQNGYRIVGDGTSNYRGDGSRIDRSEYMKDGFEEVMGGQQQQQQQRSQGSVARWETFLHIRSVKVLLVENDDSTRHVVAALLRNLNYEVTIAANGLQAWRILEDLTTHIDIVLTEVVMPCLSGIGLLCKIMNHKTRKNIPVIMMSSHDSMGLVFKCLSKGAVDFLGKPIRKNELKNLWQHVWRRCHSSSGSGSESATHTQKSVKSKSGIKSEKKSGSKEMDDDESTGLKTGDDIDDDSDSQSSWAKEVDSSQAMSAKDQTAKSSDSTCAQLCSNSRSTRKMVPVTKPKEFQEHGEQVGNGSSEKYLATGKRKNLDPHLSSPNKVPFKPSYTNRISHLKPEPYPNKSRIGINPENHSEHPCNRNKGITAIMPSRQVSSEEHARILESKDKPLDGSKVEPEVELSLKKLITKDTGKTSQTDGDVFRPPDLAASSRSKWYSSTSNVISVPNGIKLSGSLADGCPEIVKDESDNQYCSNGNLTYPSSEGGNNNVVTGSITDKLSINPTVVSKEKLTSDKLEATSTENDLNLSSVFTPMKMDLNCQPQQVLLVKTDDLASPAMLAPIGASPPELPVQHIHHHHHVHHFHGVDSEQQLSDLDDVSLKKLAEDSSHFRSLNVFVGPVEANTGNCSLNKSASGSKHGSNGQNGSSTIVHAGGTNLESDVHVAGKSGSSNASGSGSGNRIDQNKSAHREAALTKFRQKKERRFGNKVRCQNKKRLAE